MVWHGDCFLRDKTERTVVRWCAAGTQGDKAMKAIGKWRTLVLALLLGMVGAGGTAWGQEAAAAPDLGEDQAI